MSQRYDVIVLGLGAMGSAAVDHLARRGLKVLGVDQFTPPHHFGSSHGHTRLIRKAYFEHPAYVPLVQRAYENWADLETFSNQRLLLPTGALMIGDEQSAVVQGALLSAATHDLDHEQLSAQALRSRFSALQPEPEMVGVWEPQAGLLFAEVCVQSQLNRATSHHATLIFDQPVLNWSATDAGVQIETAQETYVGDHLVLSAGGWLGELTTSLNLPLMVERQVMFWFEPKANASAFLPEHMSPFMIEYDLGKYFYAFSDIGHGVKVALHHQGEITTPDNVRREVDADETEQIRGLMQRFLPDSNGRLIDAKVCAYTNTPDEHFVLDAHPQHANVTIVSCCSGHGFKFASAIGEIVADKITRQPIVLDLSLFALDRLKAA